MKIVYPDLAVPMSTPKLHSDRYKLFYENPLAAATSGDDPRAGLSRNTISLSFPIIGRKPSVEDLKVRNTQTMFMVSSKGSIGLSLGFDLFKRMINQVIS